MMKALKFLAGSMDAAPFQSTLTIERAQDIEKLKDLDLPAVYLVLVGDLEKLFPFKDLIIDRGTKNKHKGLSKYLLGHPKHTIPVVKGNYDVSGQLVRGIRTLLKNASGKGEKKLYFIGADKGVFDELWGNADHAEPTKEAKQSERTGKKTMCDPEVTGNLAWILQELKLQCTVPPELNEKYIGRSEDAEFVRRLITLAARSDNPVLVLGDTGTGKEVVARAIHRVSDRKSLAFIAVNCSAIPYNLFESELFGYVKGAFTGADSDKPGLWEIAGKGTLFLDEIGDLHQDHQSKVLRTLEEGKIRRVGGTTDINVYARVIAATNRDLFSMVQTKEFREDLYYRLRGFLIRTPALRDHQVDIPLLAQHLWKKITRDDKKTLPNEILEELQGYNWPGNVRELKMVLNNLKALFGTENLRPDHLKAVFFLAGQSPEAKTPPPSERDITLHRAECLRHLKRSHEVIHAIQFMMRPLMEENKTDEQALSLAQVSLKFRFHELETLCRRPLLFHGEGAFSTVHELMGKITYLLGLLKKDITEARGYWELDVAGAFKKVTSIIFGEIEKVLKEG